MSEVVYWQDKFITKDPDGNGYTCWDYAGNYIGFAMSIEKARELLTKYVETRMMLIKKKS